MSHHLRLLLLEDDAHLGRAVTTALEGEGYHVTWSHDLKEASAFLEVETFDGVLLDLGLPDGCGLDLLTAMRKREDRTPVLILTARDAVEDRVLGLDHGADDYLPKPFAMEELFSRLRALLRRAAGYAGQSWVLGPLTLDVTAQRAFVDGEALALSRREWQLLLRLARNKGRIVSRTTLEQSLFEPGEEPESNALEVHMHHLRKKLKVELIRTVRGLGYLLEVP